LELEVLDLHNFNIAGVLQLMNI